MYAKGCRYPGKYDDRTIRLRSVLRELPPIPAQYDAEYAFNGKAFPARMWGNDYEGCCVIAAQANFTRVLEYVERGYGPHIADKDVHDTYRLQSGGADTGLFMLDSVNAWRRDGWFIAGGKEFTPHRRGCWHRPKPIPPEPNREHLDIFAFASVDSEDELRQAIFHLHGACIAVKLPESADKQFQNGDIWSEVPWGTDITGGHAVYVKGYTKDNLFRCWTWKREQLITEGFLRKYMYHSFALVDNKDPWLPNSPLDLEKLVQVLHEVTKE